MIVDFGPESRELDGLGKGKKYRDKKRRERVD